MNRNHWIMHQEWSNLFFIHWPVPARILRTFVPDVFSIDEYDGNAWIAVVPFRMENIRFRGFHSIPHARNLLELNVRTYVSYKGEPGVYFFTLDANQPAVVYLARALLGLPYVCAKMKMVHSGSVFSFTSRRIHPRYPAAHFHSSFHPQNAKAHAKPDSLLYWLTERYALWVTRGRFKVYKGPILHKHWTLQKSTAEIEVNQLIDFLPSTLFQSNPITYYSERLQTRIFPFERKR